MWLTLKYHCYLLKHENYQVLDQFHFHDLSICLDCEFSLIKYLRTLSDSLLSDCFSAAFITNTDLI